MTPAADPERVVVGVAITSRGRVLAARRVQPARLTGWELPGGKVEPGESDAEAGVREVREELGCGVQVVTELAGSVPLGEGYVLRVVLAELVAGEPVPTEHDAVRWLAPEELDDVAWLAADRPFLPALRSVLPTHQESSAVRLSPARDAGTPPAAAPGSPPPPPATPCASPR